MKEKLTYSTKIILLVIVALFVVLGSAGIVMRILRDHPLRHLSSDQAMFVVRLSHHQEDWSALMSGADAFVITDGVLAQSVGFPFSRGALATLASLTSASSYFVRYTDGIVGVVAPKDQDAKGVLAQTFTGWVMEPCGALTCMAQDAALLDRHVMPQSATLPLAEVVPEVVGSGGPIGFQSVGGVASLSGMLVRSNTSYSSFLVSMLTSAFERLEGYITTVQEGMQLSLQLVAPKPLFRQVIAKHGLSERFLRLIPARAERIYVSVIPTITQEQLPSLLTEMFGQNIAHGLLLFAEGKISDIMPISLARKLLPLLAETEVMYAYVPQEGIDLPAYHIMAVRGKEGQYEDLEQITKDIVAFKFGLTQQQVRLPDQTRGTLLKLDDAKVQTKEVGTGYVLEEVQAGGTSVYMSEYDDVLLIATHPRGIDGIRSAGEQGVLSADVIKFLMSQHIVEMTRTFGDNPVERLIGFRLFDDRIRFDTQLRRYATP